MVGERLFLVDAYEIREVAKLPITHPANEFPSPKNPYVLLRHTLNEWEDIGRCKDPYEGILRAIKNSEERDRMFEIMPDSDLTPNERTTLRIIEDDYNTGFLTKKTKSPNRPHLYFPK
ncbi:MAG: hypothetical protein V1870_04105 [Candidatus Aenigmatarchaeota archaeon]